MHSRDLISASPMSWTVVYPRLLVLLVPTMLMFLPRNIAVADWMTSAMSVQAPSWQ